jgi:transposase-like protein
MSPQQKQLIDLLSMDGMSGRAISRLLGIPKSTVNDFLSGRKLPKAGPKILVWDVETTPTVAYVWGRFQQNVSQSQVIRQGGDILTWSAKWLGDKEVHHDSMHYYASGDDFEVVESLSSLVSQADILVHQNGDRFDLPTLNTRRIKLGLTPLPPKKTVDTLKIARAQFKFGSNRLESLAVELGLDEGKIKTDFSLWSRCMDGDASAFEEMIAYNKRDVEVLEKVYLALRPWDQRHPNVGLYLETDGHTCPKCGSTHLEDVSGTHAYTNVSKFQLYSCVECGSYSRGRENLIEKARRKNILTNVAK